MFSVLFLARGNPLLLTRTIPNYIYIFYSNRYLRMPTFSFKNYVIFQFICKKKMVKEACKKYPQYEYVLSLSKHYLHFKQYYHLHMYCSTFIIFFWVYPINVSSLQNDQN